MRTDEMFITIPFTELFQKQLAARFDCGNDALSNFLRSHDALDPAFGKTYVWIRNDNQIAGYYNFSTGYIEEHQNIRVGGSVYINCLAVDVKFHRFKVSDTAYASDLLLADCLNRVEHIREKHIGFAFVTLSSTDEGLYLYERNGFFPIEDDMLFAKNYGEDTCKPLYLPLDYE